MRREYLRKLVSFSPEDLAFCEMKTQEYGFKNVQEYLTHLIGKEKLQEYNSHKSYKLHKGEKYVIFKNLEEYKRLTADADYLIEPDLEEFHEWEEDLFN